MICEISNGLAPRSLREAALDLLADSHVVILRDLLEAHRKATEADMASLKGALVKLAEELSETRKIVTCARPDLDRQEWKPQGQPVGSRYLKERWAVQKRWKEWQLALHSSSPIEVARKWGVTTSTVKYAQRKGFSIQERNENQVRLAIDGGVIRHAKTRGKNKK